MNGKTKQECVHAIYQRYRHAGRPDKRRILDEFCHAT